MRTLFLLFLSLSSCSSYIASVQEERRRTDIAFDEMRMELADLKHTLKGTQVEVEILEEKLKKQDVSAAGSKLQQAKMDTIHREIDHLEKKILLLQKGNEQTLDDLLQLRSHANETSHALKGLAEEIHSHTLRFEEIGKLKSTLSSLSRGIEASKEMRPLSTYKVKGGDSLEKIARMHNTTVSALKKCNQIESDRIWVGQELKIP